MLALLDENPYQLLRQLRETDPVCWAPGLNAWLVTRYDLAVNAGKHLAFALVSPELAAPGSKLDVVVLGERYAAQVMPPHGGETGARR